jgi:hypothetical protein
LRALRAEFALRASAAAEAAALANK